MAWLVLLLVAASGVSGCRALGLRAPVSEEEATALLTRAVGLAATGQVEQICELSSSESSTCADTLETAGPLAPDVGPQVRCVVPVGPDGPLRGGQVLVLEGVDALGDAYLTEFIVYDDGEAVQVLDAVFWSGLSVQSYGDSSVTWRFDSASQTCARGALPPE